MLTPAQTAVTILYLSSHHMLFLQSVQEGRLNRPCTVQPHGLTAAGPSHQPQEPVAFQAALLQQGLPDDFEARMGRGKGHGAKGRAEPYIPTHQCGRDAHLGLGCMRYKDILTGKGAEDEIRVCASAAHPVNLSIAVLSVCKQACLCLCSCPGMCMPGFFPSVYHLLCFTLICL